MQRLAELLSPLGPDLIFRSLKGVERLSEVSEFTLQMVSPKADIDFKQLLGQHMSVQMTLPEGTGQDGLRFFDGIVSRIRYTGMQGRYHGYEASVQPWLWFLSRTRDCRIFQDQTVVEILQTVFSDHGIAKFDVSKLTGSYTPWHYCCQYRETDLAFVQRMMEQEGITFYFTHAKGAHTLVLADGIPSHSPFAGYAVVPFAQNNRRASVLGGEAIDNWTLDESVQPGKLVITDYDFERPSVDLRQLRADPRPHSLASEEIFDYPGLYNKEIDGEQFVRQQMEAQTVLTCTASGHTDARGLATGCLFDLTGFVRAEQNRQYLVYSTTIKLIQADYEGTSKGAGSSYACAFEVIDAKTPFRPAPLTRKPFVQGPQTAVVVGPAGDEIHTDEYGRVKIHFHWDRYGKKDGDDTCWVRVSQPWAGKNFGFQAIPRIGQEVIVDFLEGDPDQPIITGRVYNAEQMTPWDLPANKTQTGVLSRSTDGGHYGTANAFRFEDMKGKEQVWLHAERNLDTEVENDETHTVDKNRTKTIKVNETASVIGARNAFVGNNEITRVKDNRTHVVKGALLDQVGAGKQVEVGKSYSIEAGDSFSITCGESMFFMDKAGNVFITGKNFNFTASEIVQINGQPVHLNPDGGAAAMTPAPKGGGAISAAVDAQFTPPEGK